MKGKCRPQEISGNFQFILRPAVRLACQSFVFISTHKLFMREEGPPKLCGCGPNLIFLSGCRESFDPASL